MKPKQIHSKVRGVDQRNTDGSERQKYIRTHCKAGRPLVLRREPANAYDANAIGVWVSANGWFRAKMVQIGYIGTELAAELAPVMDGGGGVEARVASVTGGTRTRPTLGVNIEVLVSPAARS